MLDTIVPQAFEIVSYYSKLVASVATTTTMTPIMTVSFPIVESHLPSILDSSYTLECPKS